MIHVLTSRIASHGISLFRETLVHFPIILTSWGLDFVYFLLSKAAIFHPCNFSISAKSVAPAPDSSCALAPS